MKTTIFLILGILISFSGFPQKLNNMIFIPRGSLRIQDAGTPRTISIDNFWMSNEITNKEFRQFYNQIRNTPKDSMEWIDFVSAKKGEISKPKVIKVVYSDISDKLMNESAWKSVLGKGDYFTNPKYDNYPVVGVTWEGARYYCIWRTKEEKRKFGGQDQTVQMDYRLPTQYEWEYANSFIDSTNMVKSKELHPFDTGEKNKLGLFNLNDNVSEWTSSTGSNDHSAYKVVKGTSWKSDTNELNSILLLPDRGTDCNGFRIIQSDHGKR